MCMYIYSETCVLRPPHGPTKSGLIWQVVFKWRYEYIEMMVHISGKGVLYDRWSLSAVVLKHRFHCTSIYYIYLPPPLQANSWICHWQSIYKSAPLIQLLLGFWYIQAICFASPFYSTTNATFNPLPYMPYFTIYHGFFTQYHGSHILYYTIYTDATFYTIP